MIDVENFNNVQNKLLRAYNRVVMMYNLTEDHGGEAAKKYAEQFDKKDKLDMYLVIKSVEKFGPEETKRHILKNSQPEQEELEEHVG